MKVKEYPNLYVGNRASRYLQGLKIKEENIDSHVEKVLKEVEKMCRSVFKEFPVSSNKV